MKLEQLISSINKTFPPVHLWNPQLCEGVYFDIDYRCNWYYMGSKIKRRSLCNLFSSILCREEDNFYLKTPFEKVLVNIDCTPFLIVKVKEEKVQQGKALVLTSDCEEHILLNSSQQLQLTKSKLQLPDQSLPCIKVRDELLARVVSNVYYQLIESADQIDGQLLLQSAGNSINFANWEGISQ